MMDAPTKTIQDTHDYITGMSKTSNIEVQSNRVPQSSQESRAILLESNIDDKLETESKESMQSLTRTPHHCLVHIYGSCSFADRSRQSRIPCGFCSRISCISRPPHLPAAV